MLGHAVEQVGDGEVFRVAFHLRPVAGEDVVGAPAQQQLEGLAEQGLHGLAEDFLGVGHDPAAVAEAATGVFLRATGALHDTVEADEGGYDEFAHGDSPVGSRGGCGHGIVEWQTAESTGLFELPALALSRVYPRRGQYRLHHNQ
ncbi:hypothetical protein D3C77_606010 [compost metagenome]